MKSPNISIHVHYFASLREERGTSLELVVTSASNASELYAELKQCHGLRVGQESLRIAINDRFVDWQTELQDNDKVVFIPPVAGG